MVVIVSVNLWKTVYDFGTSALLRRAKATCAFKAVACGGTRIPAVDHLPVRRIHHNTTTGDGRPSATLGRYDSNHVLVERTHVLLQAVGADLRRIPRYPWRRLASER